MPAVLNRRYDPGVPVNSLSAHPANAREGDIGALSRVMTDIGFYGAVIVQESTRYILAGAHRTKAVLAAGAATIPVIFVDVDDIVARKILAADNRMSDLASNDQAALVQLLHSISSDTGTLEGTGYDDEDLDALVRNVERDMIRFTDSPARATTTRREAPPRNPPGGNAAAGPPAGDASAAGLSFSPGFLDPPAASASPACQCPPCPHCQAGKLK